MKEDWVEDYLNKLDKHKFMACDRTHSQLHFEATPDNFWKFMVIREIPKDQEKANTTLLSRKEKKEEKEETEELGSEGCDQWHDVSSWTTITNAAFQQSILGPILFNLFASNQDARTDFILNKIADGTKLEGVTYWMGVLLSSGTWTGWRNRPTGTS